MPPLAAHLTTDSFWRTFPGPWIAALTVAVDGALVVFWLGAKGFCTYGCPYGALFGLADRFAVGQIRVDDSCEGCGHCTAVCTSNVRVHEEVATFGRVVDTGCMKCLDCVHSCPKEALHFGMGGPSLLTRPSPLKRIFNPSPARASDLSWPEEIATGVVFAAAFLAFHGLYGTVSLMLALGLAALAAIAVVIVKRLFDRRDFRLQWSSWRSGGRLTRRGVAGGALVAAYLAFTGESALVQYHAFAGERAVRRLQVDRDDAAAARDAESHLTAALALGLFPDLKAENLLAIARYQAGDPAGALPHLQRALALERSATRLVALAAIEVALRDRDAARAALREALLLEPGNAEAARGLRELGAN
jgi:ferredoxin